ncbi:putative valacyclovir hydrolase [Thozetella sp. PMI_491]|nr:putative valacyclovir hydrolase [Thozetella sp. PMI_491]
MVQKFQLPDGRNLDYLISGAQDGFPLIFIHGTPGSYVAFSTLQVVCKDKGLKLITLSRAGYGGSTRNKGRRIVDAVQDIAALAEHLGVKNCFVGGWSGGGPHALACAARLPGCTAALSIAGVGPWNAEGLDFLEGQGEDNVEEFTAALQGEETLRKFCDVARPAMLQGGVTELIDAMASLLPPVDQEAMLANNLLGQFLVNTIKEGLKDNSDGWIDDDMAFTQPWGFELSEIRVPVFLYQGSEDKMVPFAHGKWLAEHLPQDVARIHLLEGQGHISIFLGQLPYMVDGLLSIEH